MGKSSFLVPRRQTDTFSIRLYFWLYAGPHLAGVSKETLTAWAPVHGTPTRVIMSSHKCRGFSLEGAAPAPTPPPSEEEGNWPKHSVPMPYQQCATRISCLQDLHELEIETQCTGHLVTDLESGALSIQDAGRSPHRRHQARNGPHCWLGMGLPAQLERNDIGFACKFSCKFAFTSCVNCGPETSRVQHSLCHCTMQLWRNLVYLGLATQCLGYQKKLRLHHRRTG